MFRRNAFTLVELLIVLAIVSILAALLFPVFKEVKDSARKVNCYSNFKQVHSATMLYLADYNDTFMPLNHRPSGVDPYHEDKTWVQILMPYVKSLSVFHCPSDSTSRLGFESSFDEDLVPGDVYSKFYETSKHVNIGYNYLALAPILRLSGRWASMPKTATEVSDPSATLLFADSLWTRTASGAPSGGGNYIVIPPCRYKQEGGRTLDSFGGQVFSPFMGWKISDDKAPNFYGNAWPWHRDRINLIQVDGSIRSVTPKQITQGCDVGESWTGRIKDDAYIWDTQ